MRRREVAIVASFGNRSVIPSMSITKMPTAASISTITSAETVETGSPPMRAPAGTSSDMGRAISWKLMKAPPRAMPITIREIRKGFTAE